MGCLIHGKALFPFRVFSSKTRQIDPNTVSYIKRSDPTSRFTALHRLPVTEFALMLWFKHPSAANCGADVTHIQARVPPHPAVFDHTLAPLPSTAFQYKPFASRPDRLARLLVCYVSYFYTPLEYVEETLGGTKYGSAGVILETLFLLNWRVSRSVRGFRNATVLAPVPSVNLAEQTHAAN